MRSATPPIEPAPSVITMSPGRASSATRPGISSSARTTCSGREHARADGVGEPLDRDALNRRFTGRVDIGQDDLVGGAEGASEFVHQIARPRVAMRLEHDDDPAAFRRGPRRSRPRSRSDGGRSRPRRSRLEPRRESGSAAPRRRTRRARRRCAGTGRRARARPRPRQARSAGCGVRARASRRAPSSTRRPSTRWLTVQRAPNGSRCMSCAATSGGALSRSASRP